jgi:hypothetical protein
VASICWQCNNTFGEADGRSFCNPFDADAPVSRQLLAELRRITGVLDDA